MLGMTWEYVSRVIAIVAWPRSSLDEFRVDAARQEQRRAGVPEVVEPDVRKSGPLQKRREAALPEVRGVDRRSRGGGENEPLILVAVSEDLYIP
jgi:hypothetical protein